MDNITAKELLLVLIGSSGFVGGVVSILVFIAGRLDKRRERNEASQTEALHNSAELKRIGLEERSAVEQSLWKMLEAKDAEITALKTRIEALEKANALSRPVMSKISSVISEMKREVESVRVIMLSDEETKYFQQRWLSIKRLLQEFEDIIK